MSLSHSIRCSGGDAKRAERACTHLVVNVYLNTTTNGVIILDKSDNASVYDYRLSYNPGTGFRFRVGGGSAYVDSGVVTANAWHTVFAWHDAVNDKIKIQVDNGTINVLTYSAGTTDSSSARQWSPTLPNCRPKVSMPSI